MTKPHIAPDHVSGVEATAELGRTLRQLREQKGLSVADVAERLKLPVRQIEALENGLYDNLPEPVFVRGFLRSYGRFLDMDEAELTRQLDLIAPAGHYRQSYGGGGLNYSNTRIKKGFPKWILVLLLLGGIGAAVYLWQEKSNSENAKQESVSTIPSNGDSQAVPPNLNASNVAVLPMAGASAASAPASAASTPALSGSLSAPAASGELLITTRYRTMLTVKDAQGKELINRIVPANSEHRFKDGAPFDVKMGYATGATASFGGEEIDLSKKRTEGKSVAFTAGGASAQAASAAK